MVRLPSLRFFSCVQMLKKVTVQWGCMQKAFVKHSTRAQSAPSKPINLQTSLNFARHRALYSDSISPLKHNLPPPPPNSQYLPTARNLDSFCSVKVMAIDLRHSHYAKHPAQRKKAHVENQMHSSGHKCSGLARRVWPSSLTQKEFLNLLFGVLSPVNHNGLYLGWRRI